MRLGYLGIDQHGQHYNIKKYPRKELLEHFGMKHADKMYIDQFGGHSIHSGYVINGLWITVYKVHEWDSIGKTSEA